MRFEHLLQVNDPILAVAPLSGAQLWMGLLVRVHHPERFPLGPDRCAVRELTDGRLVRTIGFGGFEFRDAVVLTPGEGLVFDTEPQPDLEPVRLTVRIERHPAHDPLALFLRFIYEKASDDAETDGVRQQAWLAADRDMLGTLRQWAEEGLLAVEPSAGEVPH